MLIESTRRHLPSMTVPFTPQPFANRPPSSGWEPVPLPDSPQHTLWIWFRPPHLPSGAIVRLPPELATYPARTALTFRWLLNLAGIDPNTLAMWYVFGTPVQNAPGMQSALDAVVPLPPQGAQPEIAFVTHMQPAMVQPMPMPMQAAPQQMPQPAMAAPVHFSADAVPLTAETQKMLLRIESEWQSCISLERQLAGLRKKVTGLLGKLNSLDKELKPEERLHADNADIKDWQDARRWLRDVSNRAQRFVKEHDIGITSMAGRRRGFEETYRTVIEPKKPVAGMENMLREFDMYRKSLLTLMNNMNNSYQTASQEGERRAQRVLARIRAKSRGAKSTVSKKRK